MYVQFAQQGTTPSWQATSSLPIVPGESTNFIVAGMLPDSTYLMRYVLEDGTVSAPLTFTTGSLPANLNFPTLSVVQPPAAGTDLGEGVLFHAGFDVGAPATAKDMNTLATNLNGNVIWYYDWLANNFPSYAQNIEPGGTVMLLGGKASSVAAGFDTLRQVNLAGDALRQTDVRAINAQLAAPTNRRSSTSTTRPSSCPTAILPSSPARRRPSNTMAVPPGSSAAWSSS